MPKIYLDLADDIQLLFEENRISIEKELADQGIDQTVIYEVPPYQEEEGVRTKEPVTVIILASAAVVLAVGYAVSRIVETLQRKPHVVEIYELEEVRDSSGNVLTDTLGQPVVKMVKRYEILEPRKEDRTGGFEFSFDLKSGVVFKVRSEETQIDQPEDKKSK
jgi:hypothetical protein